MKSGEGGGVNGGCGTDRTDHSGFFLTQHDTMLQRGLVCFAFIDSLHTTYTASTDSDLSAVVYALLIFFRGWWLLFPFSKITDFLDD